MDGTGEKTQKNSVEASSNTRGFLSDSALLIAIVSLIGYLIAIFYDYTYFDYFGVPAAYLNIRPIDVFVSASITVLTFLYFFQFIDIFTSFGPAKKQPRVKRAAFIFVFLVVALLANILINFDHWILWLVMSIATIISYSSFLIWPLFEFRNLPTWEERYEAYFINHHASHKDEATLTGQWVYRMGHSTSMFIFMSALLVMFAGDLAKLRAETQETFGVIKSNQGQEYIVIKKYDDSILALSFSKKIKALGCDLAIIEPGELFRQNITINFERIGKNSEA
jgi:hypothetical protein